MPNLSFPVSLLGSGSLKVREIRAVQAEALCDRIGVCCAICSESRPERRTYQSTKRKAYVVVLNHAMWHSEQVQSSSSLGR